MTSYRPRVAPGPSDQVPGQRFFQASAKGARRIARRPPQRKIVRPVALWRPAHVIMLPRPTQLQADDRYPPTANFVVKAEGAWQQPTNVLPKGRRQLKSWPTQAVQ